MECFCPCNSTSTPPTLPFHKAVINLKGHNFPSNLKNPKLFCPSLSTPKYTVNCNCRERTKGEVPLSSTSAYAMLGVEPDCSAAELKAAFPAKVKQFHPDVNRDVADSDSMIRRVIEAYEKTVSEVELLDIPSNMGNRTKNKTLEKANQIDFSPS
ncbi:hypothetical protein SO802_013484 [Lithocarpus litseifolius]|uniref:J domain-containing protein n=1 Tax=Lithocarpus litseifolius TaxID=425828 RepID=A0AAW2D8B2_9ROSI